MESELELQTEFYYFSLQKDVQGRKRIYLRVMDMPWEGGREWIHPGDSCLPLYVLPGSEIASPLPTLEGYSFRDEIDKLTMLRNQSPLSNLRNNEILEDIYLRIWGLDE